MSQDVFQVRRGCVTNPRSKDHTYIFLPHDVSVQTRTSVMTRVAELGAKAVECDAAGELFELSPAKAKTSDKARAERAEAALVDGHVAANHAAAERKVDKLGRSEKVAEVEG